MSKKVSASSETLFIKWSDYKSTSKNKPDILRCKCVSTIIDQSEFSIYVKVLFYNAKEGKYEDRKLALKSKNSSRRKLLDLWNKAVQTGRMKEGIVFVIKTWKKVSSSKANSDIERKYATRDFILQVAVQYESTACILTSNNLRG